MNILALIAVIWLVTITVIPIGIEIIGVKHTDDIGLITFVGMALTTTISIGLVFYVVTDAALQ